jgi:hypothetical protein
MCWLIAAIPSAWNAVDHPADVTVRLDQFRQIFRRQIKSRPAGEQNDFVLGWRVGHVIIPG